MIDFLYILIYWLHTMASVYWIGGITLLLFIVIPRTKQTLGNEAGILIGAISKKFKLHVNISIIILIVTGIAISMLNPIHVQLEKSVNWKTFLITKHILVGIMIFIHIYRNTLLVKRINLEKQISKKQSLQTFSFNLVKIVFILGLIVLLLSIMASKL